jgi:hypothetical protein
MKNYGHNVLEFFIYLTGQFYLFFPPNWIGKNVKGRSFSLLIQIGERMIYPKEMLSETRLEAAHRVMSNDWILPKDTIFHYHAYVSRWSSTTFWIFLFFKNKLR